MVTALADRGLESAALRNNPSPIATNRGVDMPVTQALRNEDEKQADAIASLARETHHPVPVVKRVFDAEYARLKANARVTDYLMLFASRHTRDTLLHMRG